MNVEPRLPLKHAATISRDNEMTSHAEVTEPIRETSSAELRVSKLADTSVVMRNTAWNFAGRAGPIVVALFATPYLLRAFGDTRWGVFTLALSLIGIFGIFDFGLGRALTRTIAERVGAGREDQAASLVLTGMLALAALGLGGAVLASCLSGLWVDSGLRIPPDLRGEVRLSLYVLCASAPLVILNAAMWGVIAAYQKFRAANLINVPILAMYYLGPLAVLQVWDSLVAAMLVLVGCRLAMTVAYWRLCLRAMPSLRVASVNFRGLRPLLRLGGWMTVSNLAFPVVAYADRFVIASVLSAAQTGYYSTPLDLVGRFSIVSVAVMGTVFPAMAGSYRIDPGNTVALFRRSILAIAAMVFPACLAVITFNLPLLTFWLGGDFAAEAASVLPWLGFGALFMCVDSVAAGLIDGIGRPDVNAKLSLLELVLYVPLLIWLLSAFGLRGAAMAWAARCCADTLVRLWLAGRLYPAVAPALRQIVPTLLGAAILLAFLLLLPPTGLLLRTACVTAAWLLFIAMLWGWSLTPRERATLTVQPGRALLRVRSTLAGGRR